MSFLSSKMLYCTVSINSCPSNNSRPLTFPMIKKISKHHNFVTTYDREITQRPLKTSCKDLSMVQIHVGQTDSFRPNSKSKISFSVKNLKLGRSLRQVLTPDVGPNLICYKYLSPCFALFYTVAHDSFTAINLPEFHDHILVVKP